MSLGYCMGPVVVGDFNAHLGILGGARGVGDPNMQGVLLHEMMVRCDLFAVSLGSTASGMTHTYFSGEVRTTVDYVIMDIVLMTSCSTLPEDDLNTSDHLPLSTEKMDDSGNGRVRIDWCRAKENGEIDGYVAEVDARISPFLRNSYDDIDVIDKEIRHVAWLLTDAANKTITSAQGKKILWHRDDTLKSLCTQSSEARREGGCPGEGP